MNETDWLKSLDQDRDIADIDVANSVMRDIRHRQNEAADDSLALPALFATLAGSLAVVIAFQTLAALNDPFASFLDSFQLVLQ